MKSKEEALEANLAAKERLKALKICTFCVPINGVLQKYLRACASGSTMAGG